MPTPPTPAPSAPPALPRAVAPLNPNRQRTDGLSCRRCSASSGARRRRALRTTFPHDAAGMEQSVVHGRDDAPRDRRGAIRGHSTATAAASASRSLMPRRSSCRCTTPNRRRFRCSAPCSVRHLRRRRHPAGPSAAMTTAVAERLPVLDVPVLDVPVPAAEPAAPDPAAMPLASASAAMPAADSSVAPVEQPFRQRRRAPMSSCRSRSRAQRQQRRRRPRRQSVAPPSAPLQPKLSLQRAVAGPRTPT